MIKATYSLINNKWGFATAVVLAGVIWFGLASSPFMTTTRAKTFTEDGIVYVSYEREIHKPCVGCTYTVEIVDPAEQNNLNLCKPGTGTATYTPGESGVWGPETLDYYVNVVGCQNSLKSCHIYKARPSWRDAHGYSFTGPEFSFITPCNGE